MYYLCDMIKLVGTRSCHTKVIDLSDTNEVLTTTGRIPLHEWVQRLFPIKIDPVSLVRNGTTIEKGNALVTLEAYDDGLVGLAYPTLEDYLSKAGNGASIVLTKIPQRVSRWEEPKISENQSPPIQVGWEDESEEDEEDEPEDDEEEEDEPSDDTTF